MVALSLYSRNYGSAINRFLRGEQGVYTSEEGALLIHFIDSALKKLPDRPGVVWRGAQLPEKERARHRVSAIVKYKAYTSTSRDIEMGRAFGLQKKSNFFMIVSSQGKDVSKYSMAPQEKETLFLRDTCFKVLQNQPMYFMVESKCPEEWMFIQDLQH